MSTLSLPARNYLWTGWPRLLPMGSAGGAHLKELRTKRGLSLEQVAQMLAGQFQIRISRSALSRYETGKRTTPDALLLWGLSKIYGVLLDDLIARGLNRVDLIRHDGSADSADAAPTSTRDADLADKLEAAATVVADVAVALRCEACPAVAAAPARLRVRRTAR